MRNAACVVLLALLMLLWTSPLLGAGPAAVNILKNGSFEEGLASAWGTGPHSSYGSTWWNSGGCKSTAGVDETSRKSGLLSLYINNPSPRSPNVYGTMAQRVATNEKQIYRLTLWAKANGLASGGAVSIIVDQAWKVRPIQLPAGTFSWKKFQAILSASNQYVDIRILSEDKGEVWIDDISMVALDDYLFNAPR